MNMDEVRANSKTSFGILVCPQKYVTETYLDGLTPTAKNRLDRGKRAHAAFEAVNAMLKATGHCGPEDVQRVAGAVGLDVHDTAKLADGLTWYAKRYDGVKPVAVEEDGGRWEFVIGGVTWKGKFDAVILGEEGLTIPDGKWAFIPWDEDTAKWEIDNIIYAERGMELYQASKVTVLLVSLTAKRTLAIEYDEADVAMYRPYLEQAGTQVHAMHEKIAAAKGAAGIKKLLADDPAFAPRLNSYCDGCGIRKECPLYARVLNDPMSVVGADTRHETYQKLGLAASLVNKARSAMSKDLKAEVETAGPDGVVEQGWRAKLKDVHKSAYTVAEHDEKWLVVDKVR